jgi:hypothetical protein
VAKKLNKLGVENSLWNNIRAKSGSGKKPTKEMLAQEKKIKKFEDGGLLNDNNNPFKLQSTQQVNPFIQAPFTEGTTPEGFFFDWINSPEYQSRLGAMGYDNPQEMARRRLNNLQNFELTQGRGKSVAHPGQQTGNVKMKPFVHLNPNDVNKYGFNSVFSHELAHTIGASPGFGTSQISKTPSDTGYTAQEEMFLEDVNINPSKIVHDRQNYEMKADLDSNRFRMMQEGIYDIRKGTPFTIDDLNKAKEKLKEDELFRRLLEQVGDENYIEMMNKLAMDNQVPQGFDMGMPNQLQAAYGGFINPTQVNPMQEQYFLGGMLGKGLTPGSASGVTGMAAGLAGGLIPGQNKEGNTSIGGSAAKGALSGLAAGASFGPIGMGIGALVGGAAGFFGGRKAQRGELAEQAEQQQLQNDQSTRNALAQMNFSNSSNLPMSYGGIMEYAYGGNMTNPMETPIGSFNSFDVGGTHESNPNGGIPQGHNQQGQLRTVEQGESAFKFPEGKYIFSNRLKYE